MLAEAGLEARLLISARRLEEREAHRRLASGVALLDDLLGGGWPRGALSELVGPRSSGRTALLLASLTGALAVAEATALIDVGGGLDPRAARRAGFALDGLLWVRCEARQALAAAEIVLAASGFGLVAIDGGDQGLRAPAAAWLRLKRTADRQGTALLVSAPRRPDGAMGVCALSLGVGTPRFGSPTSAAHQGLARACPAAGQPPPLLLGVDGDVTVTRGTRHAPSAANDGPAPSTVGDARRLSLVRP